MAQEDVTQILEAMREGDSGARDRLMELVYVELKAKARGLMARERRAHTLQPSALINEAYFRLAPGDWQSRAHFFGAAAEAMRQVLVEYARRRKAEKRGGKAERVTFSEMNVLSEEPDTDLLSLHESLDALFAVDPRLAEIVRLRYFGGLTIEETADLLNLSPATVKRDWTYARAWLYERMLR